MVESKKKWEKFIYKAIENLNKILNLHERTKMVSK